MTTTPRRRSVESVESSMSGVEQADERSTPGDGDVEHAPSSAPDSSIESVTDDRSDIERP
jgi:hypothetical protein